MSSRVYYNQYYEHSAVNMFNRYGGGGGGHVYCIRKVCSTVTTVAPPVN